jgi:hypothetical protein
MPTHTRLEESHSENATPEEKPSGTLAVEALAVEKKNLNAMPTLTEADMTKPEALAIAWTGIEALAKMKQARLYRSRKTGRVLIELLAVEFIESEGLKPLAIVV